MLRRSLRMPLVAIAVIVTCQVMPGALAANRPDVSSEAQTERYFESIRKDPNLLVAFLLEMPKGGDLHNHLSGAIYAETLIDWAAANGSCVDPTTFTLSAPPCVGPKEAASTAYGDPVLYGGMIDAFSMRNWQLSGQSGHDHFFASFDRFSAATHGNTGKELAETASRAASQHEIYQELMFTPTGAAFGDAVKNLKWNESASTEANIRAFHDTLSPLLDDLARESSEQITASEKERDTALRCGSSAADAGCRVTQRYLFQVLRGLSKETVFAQMMLGFKLASTDPRVVGLNLVMAEDWYVPMRDFAVHMQMIGHLYNLKPEVHIALHAGELVEGLVPPEDLRFHVRESVETGHAERIGHGVDTLNETNALELLNELAKKNVMVEICLTSNDVILGVRGKNHPLHDFMHAGVPVALATDDEGVSRSDMTHEYLKGVEEQDLTYRELKRMARTSLEHAFIGGRSLWNDGKTLAPVKECAGVQVGAKPAAPACQKFLDGNEKARLQWTLEQQFREFERRHWPAVKAESSRAADR
jgi:adenosine deaminase